MPAGRPPKFETPEELDHVTQEWWDSIKDTDEVPDIEGWAVYLDTTRKTIFEYESKQEFRNTVKRWKDKIFAKKKQLALRGKLNPAIFIFDAVNNTDYVNASQQRVESKNEHTHKFEGMSDEELDRAIQAAEDQLS